MNRLLLGTVVTALALAGSDRATAQSVYYNQGYNPYTGVYTTTGRVYSSGVVQASQSYYSPYYGPIGQATYYSDAYGNQYESGAGYTPYGYTNYSYYTPSYSSGYGYNYNSGYRPFRRWGRWR